MISSRPDRYQDEPMVGPLVDEIAEPIVEAEEQVIAPVIDMEEDIAMLFGNGDFSDDDSEGFEDEEEVWEVNEEWLMAPITSPPMLVVPPPSTYEVGGPSTTTVEGQSFTFPAPRLPVSSSMIEDLGTGAGYGILDDSGRRCAAEDVTDSSAADYMVPWVSQRESTLMQCILGMDRHLADLEMRPPGSQ
ncbi:hypothetical protein Tco_0833412 [Tanacetum coccineum]